MCFSPEEFSSSSISGAEQHGRTDCRVEPAEPGGAQQTTAAARAAETCRPEPLLLASVSRAGTAQSLGRWVAHSVFTLDCGSSY